MITALFNHFALSTLFCPFYPCLFFLLFSVFFILFKPFITLLHLINWQWLMMVLGHCLEVSFKTLYYVSIYIRPWQPTVLPEFIHSFNILNSKLYRLYIIYCILNDIVITFVTIKGSGYCWVKLWISQGTANFHAMLNFLRFSSLLCYFSIEFSFFFSSFP